MTAPDDTERNRALALQFLELAQAGDVEGIEPLLVEDYVQVFPRPGIAGLPAGVDGRDELLGFFALLPTMYEPGSMRMEVENVVASGPMVMVQFKMLATTASGEPYENYYVQIVEIRDGRIAKCWEYCDTLYAARMLVPDLL